MWNTARSVFDPLCEREGTGGVARGVDVILAIESI